MNQTKKTVIGGLMIALVFVATYSIRIPIPFTQGYIHAGDSMIFLAALLFGWRFGALAGGLGSCLADLLAGYAAWALPTLIIKFVMGAIVGWAAYQLGQQAKASNKVTFAATISAVWVAFILGLKMTLSKMIMAGDGQTLMSATELDSVSAAMDLALKVNNQLFLVAIAIPVLLLAFAYIGQKLSQDHLSLFQIIAMSAAGIWMVIGYYVAGSLLVGNWIAPIFSIPWNIVQFVVGMLIAYLIYIPLKNVKF